MATMTSLPSVHAVPIRDFRSRPPVIAAAAARCSLPMRQGHRMVLFASAAGAADFPKDGSQLDQQQQGQGHQQQQPQSVLSKVRAWFAQGKVDKQKLAEYGLGAFAAYGILSNLNAGVCVTLAWMAIVNQTGLTPLAAGQWPKFLGVYAGLWLGASFMRPIRLSLALAAAPVLNAFLETTQQVLKVNKAFAFGIMLFLIAASSCAFMFTCLLVAGGFPQGVPFIPSLRG